MSGNHQLPWRQICDYLLETECSPNLELFCEETMTGLQELISFDAAAYFLTDTLGEQVEQTDFSGLRSHYISAYQSHYLQYDCFKPKLWKSGKTSHIIWNEYRHTEFVTDFINPQRIAFTAGILLSNTDNSRIAALTFHRSSGKGCTDKELAILDAVQPHLSRLFSLHSKINHPHNNRYYYAELVGECKLLSKREAEVAALICLRLTAPEIAAKLMISSRTVEFHIANIYEKLKVETRRELLIKLAGGRQ